MISREQATRQALYELEQQCERNHAEERERFLSLSQGDEEIRALLDERFELIRSGMVEAFMRKEKADDLSARVSARMSEVNKTLRVTLRRKGYPEDYLQPIYKCQLCRDTGYVGEPVHDLCSCVRQRVLKIMMSDSGLQDLERQNFAAFNEKVFPDETLPGKKSTQRAYMNKLRQHMEQYADTFAPKSGKGLILVGPSGLGKTFLMNCVAERVLTRGFSVLKMTAYHLYDTLKQYNYDMSNASAVNDLISVDLLALDDLGTEPLSRFNNEQSGLYHILNERIASNGSTIITTNLNSMQIRERYGERISARLFDASRMSIYELFGQDVRPFVRQAGVSGPVALP
ncbi:MAG: ATP-binding protein [Clostridia bacterium]|nr:ATP-binding protein [Clostridia bacterium]